MVENMKLKGEGDSYIELFNDRVRIDSNYIVKDIYLDQIAAVLFSLEYIGVVANGDKTYTMSFDRGFNKNILIDFLNNVSSMRNTYLLQINSSTTQPFPARLATQLPAPEITPTPSPIPTPTPDTTIAPTPSPAKLAQNLELKLVPRKFRRAKK